MSYDFGIGECFGEVGCEGFECFPLRRRVVALRFSVLIYAACHADSYAFGVVSLRMRAGLFYRSSIFYFSVSSDYVVVADCEVSFGFVPACYFCRSYVHVGFGGGAVDDDGVNVSYVLVPPVLPQFLFCWVAHQAMSAVSI